MLPPWPAGFGLAPHTRLVAGAQDFYLGGRAVRVDVGDGYLAPAAVGGTVEQHAAWRAWTAAERGGSQFLFRDLPQRIGNRRVVFVDVDGADGARAQPPRRLPLGPAAQGVFGDFNRLPVRQATPVAVGEQ